MLQRNMFAFAIIPDRGLCTFAIIHDRCFVKLHDPDEYLWVMKTTTAFHGLTFHNSFSERDIECALPIPTNASSKPASSATFPAA
ncbi:MAG: hypothetical protein KGK35_09925 [Xanthomonadaceae bacterium]|nr:hypothetical protein [Xanthomonadaceae bacterium]MDE2498134.1 hypothetical protein [Xanthomonadaceae bacterium]